MSPPHPLLFLAKANGPRADILPRPSPAGQSTSQAYLRGKIHSGSESGLWYFGCRNPLKSGAVELNGIGLETRTYFPSTYGDHFLYWAMEDTE